MKNYFKKFSIMFVMALVLVCGWSINAFADDNYEYEIGSVNYNNSTLNSASVGVQLISPEKGWKRYDDTIVFNAAIKTSNWYSAKMPSQYWGDGSYKDTVTSTADKNASLTFSFYGNKFRLYSRTALNRATDTKVIIDGKEVKVDQTRSGNGCTLLENENSLDNKIHTVTFISGTNGTYVNFVFDCIDINESGYLLSPSIILDKSTMDLTAGDSKQITTTTTPEGATVTWTSDNTGVATVENGKVTGVKEGTCTITAKIADGLTATCIVTVAKENKWISLNKSTTNLTIEDSETLIATTTPAGISVKWSSSDTSVATVDSNGKVTAIGAGTATITATTLDGSNLSASCLVTVLPKGNGPTPAGSEYITNIAHAKGTNTNNPGGEVTIIFHGTADTTLSVVKTADVKDVWIGDNFTYTLVITNTGTKTAKAVVVNDPAPNHIDFNVSGVTTTQGSIDSSSTSKNITVNVGDILPGGTVTIKVPATVIA